MGVSDGANDDLEGTLGTNAATSSSVDSDSDKTMTTMSCQIEKEWEIAEDSMNPGIGAGGCLAYAVFVLELPSFNLRNADGRIYPRSLAQITRLLNEVTESLIADRNNSKAMRQLMRNQYIPDNAWPSHTLPAVFRHLDEPFVYIVVNIVRSDSGVITNTPELKKMLKPEPGKFIIDGFMAPTCQYAGRRIELHHDPPSKSRHAVAVLSGLVHCRNFPGRLGRGGKTPVDRISHLGPRMIHDGYLNNIARVYLLG